MLVRDFHSTTFPAVIVGIYFQAKHILKEGKISELQDPNLVDACDSDEFEKAVLAATLCIRATPQSRPDISLVRNSFLTSIKNIVLNIYPLLGCLVFKTGS